MDSTTAALWLDDGIEEQALHLYQATAEATGVDDFAAVTPDDIERFHERGYLVVNEAFSGSEVGDALDGLLRLIDGQVPEFTGIQFEARARDLLPTLSPEQKQDAVRKLMGFVAHEPRLRAIAAHPGLVAILGDMMGEPPDMFQDQALLKPPFIGREKPWHQDNAFFTVPASTPVVGVWIALDEATPENGCMHILPGTHRQGPTPHFQRRDWQICDTDVAVDRVVSVPLRPGGCLFFHGLLHHGTPPSRSSRRRRALQFHYKPSSVGRTTEDERMAVFGSEGKDVTC